jgi:hypothetical protein
MKIFTTTILSLFVAITMVNAQVVFVNSPEELLGGYEFGTAANFGTPLTDTLVTADAAFIDDGTGETATQGCMAAVNGAELEGKIALVDRGGCTFVSKALNAQNAGALGIIIFNNQPGAGVIALGGDDLSITIPVAMLSYEDGQAIRSALENGTVNITMGNLVLPNDIGASAANVMTAPYGIVPLEQVTADNFTVVPGAGITNNGLNDAANFNISATVEYTELDGSNPATVYTESTTLEETVEPDSTSSLAVLPGFVPENGIGRYTVTYSVESDSVDQLDFDNTFSSTFTISDSLYSKAQWNPTTGLPARTGTFYSTAAGGVYEMIAPFAFPSGGGSVRIDTIIYEVLSATGTTLAEASFEGYVYEWVDADEDSLITNAEVEVVGIATFAFPEDYEEQVGILRLPVANFLTFAEPGPIVNPEASAYMVGVRHTGAGSVFMAFDENISYTQYVDYKLANGTYHISDEPYFVESDFDPETNSPDFEGLGQFADVSGGVAIAIKTAPIATSTEDVVGAETFEMDIFPNPTAEKLTTNLTFKQSTSFVEYNITAANGQVLLRELDNSVGQREQAEFNVEALPAGQYFLMIRTEQGIQTMPFVKK